MANFEPSILEIHLYSDDDFINRNISKGRTSNIKLYSTYEIKSQRFTIMSLLDGIIAFSLIVIVVNIALWFEQIDKSFFVISVGASMVLFFIIIAFVIIPVTKKLTSTKNPWMFMIPLSAGIAYVLAAEILRKNFYSVEYVKVLLDGSLTMIPSITVFMRYLLIIPILMRLKNFIRKQPIRG